MTFRECREWTAIACLAILGAVAGYQLTDYVAHRPTLSASAQSGVAVQPFTYPDITGAASTTQLSSTLGCSSIQMLAPSANSASVRWGDASTSVSRGGVIAAGGGQYLPPNGSNYYPLSSLYVYIANGDKLQFVCFR